MEGKMMMSADQALFDNRPTRSQTCPRCRGCGTVVESYALVLSGHIDGAPDDAVYAFVRGSFGIFTACKEALDVAKRARRPVAFRFIDHVVVVRGDDDADLVARAWWQRTYNETPEATLARR
jgi:hypothetical protein